MLILFLSFILAGFIIRHAVRAKTPRVLPAVPRWGEDMGVKERNEVLLRDSRGVYEMNYHKYKDSIGWFVPVPGDTVEKLVVSPKYLPELKRLPQSVLSFEKAFSDAKESKYTNSPPENFFSITPRIIKSKLTSSISRLAPRLSSEASQAVNDELGPCHTWTSIKIHSKLMHIISVLSGQVFIGPELCREKRYIDAAINYTNDFSKAMQDLQSLNPGTRPFLARRLESVKALRRRENEFVSLLEPVVEARRNSLKKKNDMLGWLMDEAGSNGVQGIKHIALIQLALFAVAFHTTALTATSVLFDLAACPKYTEPLREEVERTLPEHATLTYSALQSLRKLDSFIKESIRFRPMSVATFQRRVLQSFTLSDGTFIPKGTIIECPNAAISRDPEFFTNPESFQPWRFTTEPASSNEKNNPRDTFASVSGMLGTFGFGPHACPGRFFAAAEIKMILAWMLLRYDVKMPGGMEGERYEDVVFGLTSSPDVERAVLFRRREGGVLESTL